MKTLTKKRIEDFDFQRVNSLFKNYNIESANKIYVVLSEQISSFGMFVVIRVEMEWEKPKSKENNLENLVSISINNPVPNTTQKTTLPINIVNYTIKRGNIELKSALINISDEELTITVESHELNNSDDKIEIELTSPSLYLIIPSKLVPKYLLNFNLTIHNGKNKSLLFLDHSADISLRHRKDNSEYQSLAYSIETSEIRKITFFPYKTLEVKYVFGKSNIIEYVRVGSPFLAGGISILAGALTIQFVQADLKDIAATTFAVMILPPFLQVISNKKFLYSSSDINRLEFGNIVLFIVAIVYLICVILTIGVLLPFLEPFSLLVQYKDTIYTFNLITGILFITIMVFYLILLNSGVFHDYSCDNCARKIWRRKKAKLDDTTRKTLCNLCWSKTNVSKIIKEN